MSGRKQIPVNKTKAYQNEIQMAHANKRLLPQRDKKGRFSVSGGMGPQELNVVEKKPSQLPSYLKDIGFLL
jgi:hypothetical protein